MKVKNLTIATLFFLALAGLNITTQAQDKHKDHHQAGSEAKVPETAADHKARAEAYLKKAAEYRQEAKAHNKMATDYSKTVARNPKDTNENAYIKKMRLHCERYARNAETLAVEAEEMAKYHNMRAKEIEGQ